MVAACRRRVVSAATTAVAAWQMDHREVIAFACVLVEADHLGSCRHRVIDYFSEQQRWTHAYRNLEQHGPARWGPDTHGLTS
jgi:hypothetical protein